MNLRSLFFNQVVIFLFLSVLFLPTMGSSIMKVDTISISGTIETVDRDFRFMVVNKMKIMIPPGTKIMDEKGYFLSQEHLILGESVIVEAIKVSKDLFAQKIILKSLSKKR